MSDIALFSLQSLNASQVAQIKNLFKGTIKMQTNNDDNEGIVPEQSEINLRMRWVVFLSLLYHPYHNYHYIHKICQH